MKILSIISYPRSGSSMIGLTLGQYSKCLYVGEISSLLYSGYNRKCTCHHKGETLWGCPIYSKVLERLLPLAKEYGFFDSVHGIKPELKNFLLKNAVEQVNSLKSGAELNYLSKALPMIYSVIAETAEAEIIIDSSKELEFAILRNHFLKNVYFVHVVRNPLGIIYSARKNPLHDNFKQKGINIFRSARIGVGWNVKIYLIDKLIQSLKGASLKLKYEDWCIDPELTNRKIFDLLSESKASRVVSNNNEFTVRHSHVVRGNRSSKNMGLIKINLDTQWRNNLNFKNKAIGRIFAFPGIYINKY